MPDGRECFLNLRFALAFVRILASRNFSRTDFKTSVSSSHLLILVSNELLPMIGNYLFSL